MKKLIFNLEGFDKNESITAKDSYEQLRPMLKQQERPTIVIDNGSYEARAGWSFQDSPFLKFRNICAKPKTAVNK